MTLTFVQGDSKPDLNATLKDTLTGDPIDLSAVSSVKFQMRESQDRRYTVNAAADIIDAPNGTVRYSWASDDLSRPGTYQVQFELTYTDTTVQTTNPANTITVRRQ